MIPAYFAGNQIRRVCDMQHIGVTFPNKTSPRVTFKISTDFHKGTLQYIFSTECERFGKWRCTHERYNRRDWTPECLALYLYFLVIPQSWYPATLPCYYGQLENQCIHNIFISRQNTVSRRSNFRMGEKKKKELIYKQNKEKFVALEFWSDYE